jgi:hypothetical protein
LRTGKKAKINQREYLPSYSFFKMKHKSGIPFLPLFTSPADLTKTGQGSGSGLGGLKGQSV